jgi:glucose-6-phosphate-specific signal transduction histidine kinase|tara:strand:- start:1340 stop:1726 length:387 start_codon:yes stop_codon:yes gene_type:complete
MLSIIIIFAFIAYRTSIQKILREKSQQYKSELALQKEMTLQYKSAKESERKRIAEILRDDIGNKLNILSLCINNKRSRDEIIRKIPSLIKARRTISYLLSPINLERFGLILTLTALILNGNSIRLPIK